jgi:hypothetical protein
MGEPVSNIAAERPPKKKTDKAKKKKSKPKSKSSTEPRKEGTILQTGSTIEGPSTTNVETTTNVAPALRQENTSSCSHDLGAKVNSPFLKILSKRKNSLFS